MNLFNGRKKIIALFGAILALLSLWIWHKVSSSANNELSFSPPTVTASTAAFGPVSKYVHSIGTLRPFDSVVIKSEVNARIIKVNFSEGSVVKENDLLVELDDSSAVAQLAEATAQYRKAVAEFEPIDKLANKGVLARIQRDSKKAEMDAAASRVSSYQTLLEKHKILAPLGGIIGLCEICKGQFVSPGNDLLKIVDCHPLKVDFKVAENDIEKIYVGQEIQVLVGSDKINVYPAKITAIDPECDKITHCFDVRGTLDVPEDMIKNSPLRPGRFVSVKVPIDGDQQGILVPESALEKIGDEDVLYRVVERLAIRTLVTVGMRRDGHVEIISGVNEGDIVITSGQANVLDGKEVTIRESSSTADIVNAVKEELRKRQQAPGKR
ncbi:MAG: efflux RND transporter periplasmic adaptor subunit [Holosporaceae bacterium]|nr:efflux RND transporter periplasmic adaptor subunit [Holosporaceae bacterium]